MRMLSLPSGRSIPVLGQGTWRMGEARSSRRSEVAALRLGLDLGMSLIDTAEMYGEGGAEEVVGEVISGRRAEVFLVSKVYPHNATRAGTIKACERSLRRLGTEYLDLYLLHWRGAVPLAETLEAFQLLKKDGKILDYGVSNFDVDDSDEAFALAGGDGIATNQVLYNLEYRGIEWDLLPWCRKRGIPVMAYSPFQQGAIGKDRRLQEVASRLGATTAQVALAWVLAQQGVLAIPKSGDPVHIRQNRAALDIELTGEDLADLDRLFPPPRSKVALETT